MPTIVPNQRIAKWTIVRLLAQGGQGAVYEAFREDIGQRGAFKVLHAVQMTDVMRMRFINELRAVNLIGHPSIPQVLDHDFMEDGTAYGVMQFIEGETLEARLSKYKLSLPEALAIAEMVASALAAAHAKNIIHRDIKPGNIMLKPDDETPFGERAMVLDFGIAKVQEGGAVTATGNLVGTPIYMAYEQGSRASDVDGRADVYSLGVVLYQMLCRRLPFPYSKGDPMFVVLSSKLEESTPIEKYAPDLPAELRALVNSMVQKDRTRRPSMAEVRASLRTLQGLAPAKQTGSHLALGLPAGSRLAVNGPLDDSNDDDNDPTGSAAGNAASLQAAALTPSEQKIRGEISPPSLGVPQQSVSDVITRPQRLPPVVSGPADRTAQPAPTLGIPDALASPMALTEPEKPKQPALAGSAKDASRKPSFLAASLALLGLAMTAGLLLWPRHKAQSPPTLSRHTAPVAPITTADSDKHVAVSSSLPALSRGKPGEGVQAAETSRAAASSPTAQGTPSAQPAAAKPADETNAKVPKPSRDCEPMAPSTACVFTPSLTEAQRDLLLRAFQQADAKFCAGETLRLGGLPKSPQISQAPASLRKDVASVLSLTLRGLLRDVGFPGTVRIRCPRP